MKSIGLVLIMMTANAPLLALAGAGDLSAYTWQYRPLIVVAPDAEDPRMRRQSLAFSAVKAAMLDRNIVMIEVIADRDGCGPGPR